MLSVLNTTLNKDYSILFYSNCIVVGSEVTYDNDDNSTIKLYRVRT